MADLLEAYNGLSAAFKRRWTALPRAQRTLIANIVSTMELQTSSTRALCIMISAFEAYTAHTAPQPINPMSVTGDHIEGVKKQANPTKEQVKKALA